MKIRIIIISFFILQLSFGQDAFHLRSIEKAIDSIHQIYPNYKLFVHDTNSAYEIDKLIYLSSVEPSKECRYNSYDFRYSKLVSLKIEPEKRNYLINKNIFNKLIYGKNFKSIIFSKGILNDENPNLLLFDVLVFDRITDRYFLFEYDISKNKITNVCKSVWVQ